MEQDSVGMGWMPTKFWMLVEEGVVADLYDVGDSEVQSEGRARTVMCGWRDAVRSGRGVLRAET